MSSFSCFEPREKERKPPPCTGPTSRVYPSPVGKWNEEGFMIPHEPIRLDMLHMQRLVSQQQSRYLGADNEWRVVLFFKWYNTYFYPMIHHHHDTEEKIYFPWVATKAQLPQKLTMDHKGLMDLLDAIKAMEGTILSTPAASRAQVIAELGQKIDTLNSSMGDHLAEEERVIAPLLLQHFTPEEEAPIIQEVLKDLGVSGNALMLPWIEDAMYRWAGEEYTANFMSKIPKPITVMNDLTWREAHFKNNRGILEALERDTKPEESHCVIS
eukprot:CAMPEP_0114540786 /NCGR_PEP_ID=MMETSP0114-20121206/959_1 /TAXON_ID=31324 /ORGANISM="Goniomonas sp, Strain m" /LENGTH=268 /DNA_ID=CAMNT_0001724983 /DNA_START=25 /DNA_END=831 /DNA_ORIENTATION=+